ncbi:unnamed protein product [Litomosoides sigmodontis]|uniref:Uncharacterized protein n=1 Tax=Litomosoides sigmodontis TaxID=42156 RepID=A0A3P6TPL0_LITSI|nr:unnamed protein product [Litomosoides sigmodontis]
MPGPPGHRGDLGIQGPVGPPGVNGKAELPGMQAIRKLGSPGPTGFPDEQSTTAIGEVGPVGLQDLMGLSGPTGLNDTDGEIPGIPGSDGAHCPCPPRGWFSIEKVEENPPEIAVQRESH